MTAPIGRRLLGDLSVAEQGLGCMGMSEFYGDRDDEESLATIREAVESGASMLDTSDMYGTGANEELIGRALAGRRDQAVIATKFGVVRSPWDSRDDYRPLGVRGDRAYVHQAIAASLTRLRTDHVDLYYLHRVDPAVPLEETVAAMGELVAEGKVRHLGLSEVSAEQLRRAHAVHPITAVQLEWSLWTRDAESDVIPAARELGIGIVAYSPLGRGLITSGPGASRALGRTDLRRGFERWSTANAEHNRGIVEQLTAIAEGLGLTTAQLALAWVAGNGDDVVPIPGTKRRTYLRQNIAATRTVLSSEEHERIAEIASGVRGSRY